MDILDKLRSQIGDDVQHVFDREALFKEAIACIQDLRQYAAGLEKELTDRTKRLERKNNLLMAQVERLLVLSNSMDNDFEEHKRAADALAAYIERDAKVTAAAFGRSDAEAWRLLSPCAAELLEAYRATKEGGA